MHLIAFRFLQARVLRIVLVASKFLQKKRLGFQNAYRVSVSGQGRRSAIRPPGRVKVGFVHHFCIFWALGGDLVL